MLSDTKVYEPQIRALLRTASHFCPVVNSKSRSVPNGITPSFKDFPSDPPDLLNSESGAQGGSQKVPISSGR